MFCLILYIAKIPVNPAKLNGVPAPVQELTKITSLKTNLKRLK